MLAPPSAVLSCAITCFQPLDSGLLVLVERPLAEISRPLVLVERPLAEISRPLVLVERLLVEISRPLAAINSLPVRLALGVDGHAASCTPHSC